MSKYRKVMRKVKAISPIIATLILILITVVAGALVYSFVGGYMSSLTSTTTSPPPNIQFVNEYVNSSKITKNLIVSIYNPSSTAVDLINSTTIYFSNGTLANSTGINTLILPAGSLTTITNTTKVVFDNSSTYYIVFLTTSGYQLRSPMFPG
ncbi:MAG: type IV pilin [Nitrososphaerota archaeon]|nr:type IV pilin [Nitrososphaerota archaeon]MDG7051669.1 type IV pilin [Nitrososphaerota archaeon]